MINKIIEFGFYLFIFLLPWQTRLIWQEVFLNGVEWEYGRFSLYGTEILLWLILILFGLWLWRQRPESGFSFFYFFQQLKKPLVLTYWLVVLFVIIAGLSVFWALDSNLAFNRFFILLEAITLFCFVFIFPHLKIKSIAISWVGAAALQGVFGIWQFFQQLIFANKWFGLANHSPTTAGSIILQTQSERWLRAYGSLPHPNIFGGFLVLGLIFLIYLALSAKNRQSRIFVLTSLLLIFPGLFFSFSRSAWLVLILTLLFFSFFVRQSQNRFYQTQFFKILILMALLFSILLVNLWQPFFTRVIVNQDSEINSLKLRLTYAQQATALIQNNFWSGVGLGNYTLAVYQKINQNWPGWYYQPVHNIYLLVLTELGFFGALIFYLVIFLVIGQFVRLVLKKSIIKPETLVFILALIAILIISLFDHYFWSLYFGQLVFWLILGLNLRLLKK